MTSLKNMTAVKSKSSGKGKDYLGYICWYTLYGTKINRINLQDKFIDAKVDLRYMPNKIKPVDAFRRATAELEENRLPYGEKYQNFLVREVLCDKSSVVRQLIRETVDSKSVRLEYTKVGEMVFYRDYEQIRVVDYGAGERLSKVEDMFARYKETYDGQHLRRVVRTILADMNPAAVRPSGGVYFVPQKYRDLLFALERLVRSISGEFFTMPLIDQENSRDMLYRKFTEQVEHSIKQINLLVSDNASPRDIAQAKADSERLKAQIEEYEAILQTDLNTLKAGLSVMRQYVTVASLTDISEKAV